MNKNLYKLVWNNEANGMIPVSEIAKHKSAVSKKHSPSASFLGLKPLHLLVSSMIGLSGFSPAFSETIVYNFDALKAAIDRGETDIKLGANINISGKSINLKSDTNIILDGGGFDLTFGGNSQVSNAFVVNGSKNVNLTFQNFNLIKSDNYYSPVSVTDNNQNENVTIKYDKIKTLDLSKSQYGFFGTNGRSKGHRLIIGNIENKTSNPMNTGGAEFIEGGNITFTGKFEVDYAGSLVMFNNSGVVDDSQMIFERGANVKIERSSAGNISSKPFYYELQDGSKLEFISNDNPFDSDSNSKNNGVVIGSYKNKTFGDGAVVILNGRTNGIKPKDINDDIILNLAKGSKIGAAKIGIAAEGSKGIYIRNAGEINAETGISTKTNGEVIIDLIGGTINAPTGIKIESAENATLRGGTINSSAKAIDAANTIIKLEGNTSLNNTGSSQIIAKELNFANSQLNLNNYGSLDVKLTGNGVISVENSQLTFGSNVGTEFSGKVNIQDGSKVTVKQYHGDNIAWDTKTKGSLAFNNAAIDNFKNKVNGSGSIEIENGSAITMVNESLSLFNGKINLNSSSLTLDQFKQFNNELTGNGSLNISNSNLTFGSKVGNAFAGTIDILGNSQLTFNQTHGDGFALNVDGTLNLNKVHEVNNKLAGKGLINITDNNFKFGSNVGTEFAGKLHLTKDTVATIDQTHGNFTNATWDLGENSTLNMNAFEKISPKVTGTGVLHLDKGGSDTKVKFDTSFGNAFAGTVELTNNTFELSGADNLNALSNAVLKVGKGNKTIVGNGENKIGGLAINGGQLVFNVEQGGSVNGTITSTQRGITIDASEKGRVQLLNSSQIEIPKNEEGFYSLNNVTTLDDGQHILTLAQGDTDGVASNLELVNDKGETIGEGAKEVDIVDANGNVIAKGIFNFILSTTKNSDFSFENGKSGDGLYVNYGLSGIKMLGETLALAPSVSSNKLSHKNDLKSKMSGTGDIVIKLQGDNLISLSNGDNDYTGKTLVESGVLYIGKNSRTGTGATIVESGAKLVSIGTVQGDLENKGTVNVSELTYNDTERKQRNPILTVNGKVTNEGDIYINKDNLDGINSLSVKGSMFNSKSIFVTDPSNNQLVKLGNNLAINSDYVGDNGAIYLNTDLGKKLSDNVTILGRASGKTTVYVKNINGENGHKADNITSFQGKTNQDEMMLIHTGVSTQDAFVLGNVVTFGGYEYLLNHNTADENWYLSPYIEPTIEAPTPVIRTPEQKIKRVDLGNHLANMESIIRWQVPGMGDVNNAGGLGASGLNKSTKDNSVWNITTRTSVKKQTAENRQIAFDYDQTGTMFGADHQIEFANGQSARLGIMLGKVHTQSHAKNNLSQSEGDGSVSGETYGIYGSWSLDKESTLSPFVGVFASYGFYDQKVNTEGNTSTKSKARTKTFSLQGGYPIVSGNLVVEPQAQISYIDYSVKDFFDHNNQRVKLNLKGHTISKLGAYFYPKEGNFKPYAGLNVWFDNTRSEVAFGSDHFNNKTDKNSLFFEGKLGAQVKLQQDIQISGEVNYRKGKAQASQWGASIGVKYEF